MMKLGDLEKVLTLQAELGQIKKIFNYIKTPSASPPEFCAGHFFGRGDDWTGIDISIEEMKFLLRSRVITLKMKFATLGVEISETEAEVK